MTTSTDGKRLPALDVRRPAVQDEPSVWTGARAVAPGPLPKNLAATMPAPLPFSILAVWHDPLALFVLLALGALAAFTFVYIAPHMPLISGALTVLILGAAAIITPLVIAPARAVRPALIIRKDTAGRTEVDEQKWWRQDARKWSDNWRWIIEGAHGTKARLLIIDAQEYDPAKPDPATLHPFQPWLAPLPIRPDGLHQNIRFHATSPAEIGMTFALGVAVREWLDVKNPRDRLVSHFMLGVLIAVAFLAMYLGGSQVTAMLSDKAQLEATLAAQAEIQAGIRAEMKALFPDGAVVVPAPTRVSLPEPAPFR